jgi:hypothetical protein
MGSSSIASSDLLRHCVATLAYRASKVLRDAPEGFSAYCAGGGTRTAGQILAHMGDLFDWALSLANGEHTWHVTPPGEWQADVDRFFAALQRFEARLAAPDPLGTSSERLFQGPVADALTHVGQLAILRRLAGAPVKGENYYKAEITAGRAGADQPAPRVEFD